MASEFFVAQDETQTRLQHVWSYKVRQNGPAAERRVFDKPTQWECPGWKEEDWFHVNTEDISENSEMNDRYYVTHVTTFASDHHDFVVETEEIPSSKGGARAPIVGRRLDACGGISAVVIQTPFPPRARTKTAPLPTFEKVLIIPLPRNERGARTHGPFVSLFDEQRFAWKKFHRLEQNPTPELTSLRKADKAS